MVKSITISRKFIYLLWLFINSFLKLFLLGLNCVPGYRLSDWTSYVSNWDGTIPIGEDDSIRDDCLRLAQKNVKDLVGIYWNFAGGYCRAITSYQSLLPWPNSFPQDKSTTKLCVFSHLIGENGIPLLVQILDSS